MDVEVSSCVLESIWISADDGEDIAKMLLEGNPDVFASRSEDGDDPKALEVFDNNVRELRLEILKLVDISEDSEGKADVGSPVMLLELDIRALSDVVVTPVENCRVELSKSL